MDFDISAFLKSAAAPSEAPVISSSGVYAVLLRDTASLPGVTPGRDGLLYVGMTNDGLDARNHFQHEHSGFSTLRRSIGALLKELLQLQPVPRAPGASRSNVVNYRFTPEGEKALSGWMERNLLIAQSSLGGDIVAIERDIIRLLEPPLNLTGWPNPQRAHLKYLRSLCVAQAERVRNA
jgi:hypothetical protein